MADDLERFVEAQAPQLDGLRAELRAASCALASRCSARWTARTASSTAHWPGSSTAAPIR